MYRRGKKNIFCFCFNLVMTVELLECRKGIFCWTTKTKTSNECIYNDTCVSGLSVIPSPAHTFKRTQALWTCFSKDFVSMNAAGISTPFCFWTVGPLAWPLEDNLCSDRLPPRFILFSLIIFSMLLLQCGRKRAVFNRRVRGQEEEGKDAGQIGSTVVFSQSPQRIHCHKAIWTLDPPAVCQKMTLSIDCYLVWQLEKFLCKDEWTRKWLQNLTGAKKNASTKTHSDGK